MSQPTVYDTTGTDVATQQAMAQMIAGNMAASQPFSVVGPYATTVLAQAQGQNALDFGASPPAQANATSVQPTGAANSSTGNSWLDNILNAMSAGGGAGGFAAGPAAQAAAAGSGGAGAAAAAGGANPQTLKQYTDAGQAGAAATSPVTTWIQAHAGNWGLILLGVVLGVGALLISQKDTIINISKKVGEAGALAA
jgi:hypothetical protein